MSDYCCTGCGKMIDIITSRTWFPALSGYGNMCGSCTGSTEQMKMRRDSGCVDETKEKDLVAFEEEYLYDEMDPRKWNWLLPYCAYMVFTGDAYPGAVTLLEIYKMTLAYCKLPNEVSVEFLESLCFQSEPRNPDTGEYVYTTLGKTYFGIDPQYLFSGEEREPDEEFACYAFARDFPFSYNRGYLGFRPQSTKGVAESEFCIFSKNCL